jgi:hypothetical protein
MLKNYYQGMIDKQNEKNYFNPNLAPMKFSQLILFYCIAILFEYKCAKFELGKVSVEELKEKVHPKDTAAAAAIIYKKKQNLFRL